MAEGAHPAVSGGSDIGGQLSAMTTITMRYINGAFLVTGKDIEARKFESRREAKDWCVTHYSGSPIYEIGADSSKRITRAMPRKGPLRRRGPRTAKIKEPAESGGISEGRGRSWRRSLEWSGLSSAAQLPSHAWGSRCW